MDDNIDKLRKAIKGAGGSMKIEADGSRFYFLHGLVVAIRGQKFVDGNGDITTVDTRRIKYNKDTQLQTGYTRISTDSQGNVTVSIRSNITYTADSNSHGKQLVTSYKDTNVDANGNISTVVRSNIQYFDPGVTKIDGVDKRGLYATSYDEVDTDQFGNATVIHYANATYDRYGDNWYVRDFDQTETDSNGNTTVTERRGTTYVFNTNYQKLESIHSTRQEFLASSYTQVVTDATGLTHTESWSGAVYDNRDNLVSYQQTNTNGERSAGHRDLVRRRHVRSVRPSTRI